MAAQSPPSAVAPVSTIQSNIKRTFAQVVKEPGYPLPKINRSPPRLELNIPKLERKDEADWTDVSSVSSCAWPGSDTTSDSECQSA